ncbi:MULTISPECIES: AraC family transcriptional regulator [unclassified Salinivibrio]|uniref:AraC family transcriptional regulator n=1 Tax=unclassified Salinivibrio TaxID=2636825 RepID=UPI000614697C|nr:MULTISPECIES: AraC family transcriptional regulator [unclassified Salinivibrio]KKA46396.1 AraC family transcriptional regulator [Salinivibrio sp. KP-1]OOE67340.1 AraC family transcriptional regulator [Salinivibrio sp. IB868]OOE77459.1 AraC family transcriptional regulator [Salinivibrio sp. IB870]OOE81688.1 AraC family transcriptional regulator [Salinivibrio sp. ML198]
MSDTDKSESYRPELAWDRGAKGLASRIEMLTGDANRLDTDIQGLCLHRWPHPTDPTSYMLAPSICLIGLGRKQVVVGEDTFLYDASQFLITSIDLPVVSKIIEASKEKPYLGLTMEMDFQMLSQLIMDNPAHIAREQTDKSLGIAVNNVDAPLLDAFNRLLDLVDEPEDSAVLAPLIQREILYRLLKGDQGARLRNMAASGQNGYRISKTIEWLKKHYRESIKVEEMAGRAGLSVSAFHHHFRAMTAMTPLQYQKRMRLSEARRLMLTEHVDASRAAFQVGYESPSQFSREYSRMFGAPPMQDIRNLVQQSA